MDKRLKELRNRLGLTQKEFGEKIGVTNFTISDIEKGKRTLTDRNMNLICEKYNVNKEWLETGSGEMFRPVLPVDEFSQLLSEIEDSEDEFIKNALWTYWQLDEKSKKVIRDFTYALAEKQKKK